jgi:hypothetical protein
MEVVEEAPMQRNQMRTKIETLLQKKRSLHRCSHSHYCFHFPTKTFFLANNLSDDNMQTMYCTFKIIAVI